MRPSTLIPAVALALGALASGCTPAPAFTCSGNDSCVNAQGAQGLCESDGHCSFPDPGCSGSRRRVAPIAGSSAIAACVPAATSCIAQLSLGAEHSCALRTDGAIFCWGDNTDGKLGDGTANNQLVPTQVRGLPKKATVVSAGEYHTCAVLEDDTVWCWGGNDAYELGTGDNSARSLVPVRVQAANPLPDGGYGPLRPFSAQTLAVGGAHTCAVNGGSVSCWGENQAGGKGGQCGWPTLFDDLHAAAQVNGIDGVVEVSAGDEFTCARKDDSSVSCWGVNADGELGNNSTTDSYAPVANGLTSVKGIAAGDEHMCVLKADNSVWCWGYGKSGSVGQGSFENQLVPTKVTSAAAVYVGGTTFATCAVQPDGTMPCWGDNTNRQTGTGSTQDNLSSPTPALMTAVSKAALGATHGCATTLEGQLWCWGSNEKGQLGLNEAGAVQAVPRRVTFPCP